MQRVSEEAENKSFGGAAHRELWASRHQKRQMNVGAASMAKSHRDEINQGPDGATVCIAACALSESNVDLCHQSLDWQQPQDSLRSHTSCTREQWHRCTCVCRPRRAMAVGCRRAVDAIDNERDERPHYAIHITWWLQQSAKQRVTLVVTELGRGDDL